MPPRSAALALTAVLLAGCVRQLIPTELATAGRVYVERQDSSGTSLVPAPGVLVLAGRINVCDRGRFVPDGSTTGVDSYLVRTDARGGYQIPPRRFTGVCSRVVLLARAFVPGHHSLSGRAAERHSVLRGTPVRASIRACMRATPSCSRGSPVPLACASSTGSCNPRRAVPG